MTADNFPAASGACEQCGCELDSWDRHLRFRLPDAVSALEPAELRARSFAAGDFLEVRGYGSYIRCLLRVTLTQDNTVTFGVWLAVRQRELHRAAEVWNRPEYAGLQIFGVLANAVPPWGERVSGAPARAVVRGTDDLPYVMEGFTPLLDEVLTRIWPHQQIHAALPHS